VLPSASTYQLRPAAASCSSTAKNATESDKPIKARRTNNKKGNCTQSTDISTYDVSSEKLCGQCQGTGGLRCNICLLYFDHECANLTLETYDTLRRVEVVPWNTDAFVCQFKSIRSTKNSSNKPTLAATAVESYQVVPSTVKFMLYTYWTITFILFAILL